MIYANMVDCDVFISLREGAVMLDTDDRAPFTVLAVCGVVRSAGDDFLRIDVAEALTDLEGEGVTFAGGSEVEMTLHASAIHLVQLLAEPDGDDDGGTEADEEEEEDEVPPAAAKAAKQARPRLRAVG
jgi:hypothetical protein